MALVEGLALVSPLRARGVAVERDPLCVGPQLPTIVVTPEPIRAASAFGAERGRTGVDPPMRSFA